MTEPKPGLKRYIGNVHPSVMAVWAALIAVASILPTIPLIGTGGTFSVGAILVPLAGILFGPIAGMGVAAAGGLISQLIAPHTAWLGMATFTIGIVNALVTGLVSRRSWLIPIIILGLGWLLFITHEIGSQAVLFPTVFYGLGAIFTLVGAFFASKLFASENVLYKGIGIWLASFAGMAAAAAYANYLGLILVQIPAHVWHALVVLAPVERALFSLGAAIIGVPLIIGLPKIGMRLGPGAEIEETEEI